jgi:hypothetical protein
VAKSGPKRYTLTGSTSSSSSHGSSPEAEQEKDGEQQGKDSGQDKPPAAARPRSLKSTLKAWARSNPDVFSHYETVEVIAQQVADYIETEGIPCSVTVDSATVKAELERMLSDMREYGALAARRSHLLRACAALSANRPRPTSPGTPHGVYSKVKSVGRDLGNRPKYSATYLIAPPVAAASSDESAATRELRREVVAALKAYKAPGASKDNVLRTYRDAVSRVQVESITEVVEAFRQVSPRAPSMQVAQRR